MQTGSAPTFGNLLREFRIASSLTQEELAELAGLSAHGIQKLERGVLISTATPPNQNVA
jgi:transcriptional regulator with XRE-family HTH domain